MAELVSTSAGQTLNGTSAADKLFANHENVVMNGGSGDDEYTVNAAGAVINEFATGGTDTIFAFLDSYSIASLLNIEDLHGSNDTGGQTMTGNSGNNFIADGLGAIADLLEGGAGNDTLFCNVGSDTLVGGTGNDRYFIDTDTVTIVEQADEGIDIIAVSMATYSIENMLEIENLAARTNIGHTFTGNAKANVITGRLGIDFLNGGAGNDTLNGNGNSDTLAGGSGNDIYLLRNHQPEDDIKIIENSGSGTDTVKSALANFSLRFHSNVENIEALKGLSVLNYTLRGNTLDNKITGLSANDTLSGWEGRDTLIGAGGRDQLFGGINNDILIGGRGADRHSGGLGNDFFRFDSYLDSRAGTLERDVITDFAKGDRIDLQPIDAKSTVAGNNAFTFIGTNAFSLQAGQLHYRQENNSGTSNDRTIVEVDINGNGTADLQIQLTGLKTLTAGDFFL
jgi:Ca2+-binding RTX toxin-like protein